MFARQPRVTEGYLCVRASVPQYDIHMCLLPAWTLIRRQWRRTRINTRSLRNRRQVHRAKISSRAHTHTHTHAHIQVLSQYMISQSSTSIQQEFFSSNRVMVLRGTDSKSKNQHQKINELKETLHQLKIIAITVVFAEIKIEY